MKYVITIISLMFLSLCSNAQSIEGIWKTIDDKTGEVKSIVELYQQDGKLYGKILEVFKQPDKPLKTVCKECKDDRKGQTLVGLEIITALQKDKGKWVNDDAILDPENGKIYDCKVWLDEDDRLAVRGYIGFLYRTQYWQRVK